MVRGRRSNAVCAGIVKHYRRIFRRDLDFQLFVQGVVDPQVDVASPVSLLLDGRDVGDGSLIHVSHRVDVGVVLHQTEVVEPGVVVVWVCLDSQEDGVRLRYGFRR